MTAICINPVKQSLAQPTKFQLTFDRVANTVFYCTKITIPGMTLTENEVPNPFTDLKVPGDKIKFEPLEFTFMVDSAYNSWNDVHDWMTGLGFPENFDQYKNLASNAKHRPGFPASIGVRAPYSDAILTIYTNKNNPQARISFKDCFPIGLSGLPLGYNESADHAIFAQATFRYSYYTFEKIA